MCLKNQVIRPYASRRQIPLYRDLASANGSRVVSEYRLLCRVESRSCKEIESRFSIIIYSLRNKNYSLRRFLRLVTVYLSTGP